MTSSTPSTGADISIRLRRVLTLELDPPSGPPLGKRSGTITRPPDSYCHLCTGRPGEGYLEVFAKEDRHFTRHLQSILAAEVDPKVDWVLCLCPVCHHTVTELYNLRKRAEVIENRIRTLVVIKEEEGLTARHPSKENSSGDDDKVMVIEDQGNPSSDTEEKNSGDDKEVPSRQIRGDLPKGFFYKMEMEDESEDDEGGDVKPVMICPCGSASSQEEEEEFDTDSAVVEIDQSISIPTPNLVPAGNLQMSVDQDATLADTSGGDQNNKGHFLRPAKKKACTICSNCNSAHSHSRLHPDKNKKIAPKVVRSKWFKNLSGQILKKRRTVPPGSGDAFKPKILRTSAGLVRKDGGLGLKKGSKKVPTSKSLPVQKTKKKKKIINIERSIWFCHTCGKRFRGAWDLRRHLERPGMVDHVPNPLVADRVWAMTEEPQTPHKCGACKRPFQFLFHLKRHMENVHKNEMDEDKQDKE